MSYKLKTKTNQNTAQEYCGDQITQKEHWVAPQAPNKCSVGITIIPNINAYKFI